MTDNPGKEALTLARNMVRVGRVNSINKIAGTVTVLFEDRDNSVSIPLPILQSAAFPQVKDQVLCIFLGNGIEVGFCLGKFYSKENPPQVGDG